MKKQTVRVGEIAIFSNNSRKIHGIPLRRKGNAKKRLFTRCEAMEATEDFLNYCNGVYYSDARKEVISY